MVGQGAEQSLSDFCAARSNRRHYDEPHRRTVGAETPFERGCERGGHVVAELADGELLRHGVRQSVAAGRRGVRDSRVFVAGLLLTLLSEDRADLRHRLAHRRRLHAGFRRCHEARSWLQSQCRLCGCLWFTRSVGGGYTGIARKRSQDIRRSYTIRAFSMVSLL